MTMSYTHWNDREHLVPIARKMVRENKTLREVADACGFKSASSVRSWLKRYGIPTCSTRRVTR